MDNGRWTIGRRRRPDYFLSPARSIALSDPTALRSWNFWILPVDVFGSSPKRTAFGT